MANFSFTPAQLLDIVSALNYSLAVSSSSDNQMSAHAWCVEKEFHRFEKEWRYFRATKGKSEDSVRQCRAQLLYHVEMYRACRHALVSRREQAAGTTPGDLCG